MKQSTILANIALLLFSLLVAILLVEIAYRAVLFKNFPEKFRQSFSEGKKTISVVNEPMLRFNAKYGFDYIPDREFILAQIVDERLSNCSYLHSNTSGSWGTPDSDYAHADFKVLVVGDSVTAVAVNGMTWTDYLQKSLSDLTGKKVGMRNLARDGQGILQMLDIAAGEISKQNPHLLIIAFISDDTTRARTWRRVENVNGRSRVFTTTADPYQPFDFRKSVETYLINPDPRFSKAWCNSEPKPGPDDPVIRETLERYRLAVAHSNARADLFTLERSFVWDVLIHHNPFYYYLFISKGAVSINPRHRLKDFAEDRKTVENVQRLRQSNVPIALVHLSLRTELKKGTEYIPSAEPEIDKSLLLSLERLLGTRIILSGPYIKKHPDVDGPADDFGAMGQSISDDHPSVYGMKIYARIIVDALRANGFLGKASTKVAPTHNHPQTNFAPPRKFLNNELILDGTSYQVVKRLGGAVEGFADFFDRVYIRGWAIDRQNRAPALEVVVTIDNDIVARTKPKSRRTDIENGFGSYTNPAGFDVNFSLHNENSSPVKMVRVFALTEDRKAAQLTASKPIVANMQQGSALKLEPFFFSEEKTDGFLLELKMQKFTELINRSPLFESSQGWGPGFAKAAGHGPGVVVGPGHDNPNVFTQQFSTKPYETFKIVARAASVNAPNAKGRFQINWLDSKRKFINASVKPFEVIAEEKTYEHYAMAPTGADAGILYIVAHGPKDVVRYTEMSLFSNSTGIQAAKSLKEPTS